MKHCYFWAILILLEVLVGCGGTSREVQKADKLVVIGNSITHHDYYPSIGWTGNWGMAASAEDKDFAHLSAAGLKVPLTAENVADLERNPASQMSTIIPQATAVIDRNSIVVVELGDNVADITAFQPAYRELLRAAGKSSPLYLVCLSTFWEKPNYDSVIKSECTAAGGTYVYIGDIYSSTANPDYVTPVFSNPDVNGHPHDWSMAKIAERIVSAVGH
jgi:alpha-galactosidase